MATPGIIPPKYDKELKMLKRGEKIALTIALIALVFNTLVGIIYLIDRYEIKERKNRVMLNYALSRKTCADNYPDNSQERTDCFLNSLDEIQKYGFDTIDYLDWWEVQTEAMKEELEAENPY